MQLWVNGELCDVDAGTLADALEALGYPGAHVATAVNGAFVPASARAGWLLHADDALEILAPMQGG
jgi:sulfur carrier protein